MKVFELIDGLPIKCWANNIEEGALLQAYNLAQLPFLFKYVALMPDCHQGYGMPIGGVIATQGVVIPNAVGVDIGCGMCACKTSLSVDQATPEVLKQIMGLIRHKVPVGFAHHQKPCDLALMPHWGGFSEDGGWQGVVNDEYKSAMHQLGTLGGGNHFIELQKDGDGMVWIMIHSGSRNLGEKVADHYNSEAKILNANYFSSVPAKHDLAFLPLDSVLGRMYIAEMEYCVAFADASRLSMMRAVLAAIKDVTGKHSTGRIISIAHNYAAMEHHFGKNVMVHRKGATLAREGDIGIIPGSQGSKSYIVQGLGNPESFMSCSHGAGRAMGRKAARKNLNLEDEIAKMDAKGIIHGMRSSDDLDEAASAYKDIDVVMKNQADLVRIVTELTPIAVIKG